MNLLLYIIIFAMGITFGSFYTLAVYRIPKGQDIVHTHSYCPNCKHKLGFWDLIPVFSYIFLDGKCRYCKQKIRPRYLILELLSGATFVIAALIMKFDIYYLNLIQLLNYIFFALFFTFIVLLFGIWQEYKKFNKSVLIYGAVITVFFMIYLWIIVIKH